MSKITVPVMSEVFGQGTRPEYLYWVGCAGAFDDRYKKVTQAFTRILHFTQTSYAVLGTEETCNGDPARRAGNEMLFQMQALQVIEILKSYEVKKILTTCPHCYNIFKNEYPDLGGSFELLHHSQFLRNLIDEGKLPVKQEVFRNQTLTFHDPCYLGRGNGEYEAPRAVLNTLNAGLKEMDPNRSFALCCGAGGAQMFKEAEPGNREVYALRTEQAIASGAGIVATACPFCMTMLTDGLKYKDKAGEIKNYDIAELIALSLGLQ